MSVVIPTGLFIVSFVSFWLVQWYTGFFSTRYLLQMGSLLTIGLLALLALYSVYRTGCCGVSELGAIILGGLAAYHLGLLVFRVLFDSDNKYRWIHKANRALVQYALPHRRLTLRTEDGVRIQALDLTDGQKQSDRAVIVCHGAGRSKNTLAIVQTCAVLTTDYDVFTFDFRGHMESGGVYRANHETVYDLNAMLKYIKERGYQHIAVVGWSVGANTAFLAAANGQPIDAIVAGAPPPVSLAEYKHIRLLRQIPLVQLPGAGMAAVSRYMRVAPAEPIMNVMEYAERVPDIPILLVYNEHDSTLNVPASAFQRLARALPSGTDQMCLAGTGHVFDWPNTYLFWNRMLEWLAVNF